MEKCDHSWGKYIYQYDVGDCTTCTKCGTFKSLYLQKIETAMEEQWRYDESKEDH